MTVRPTSSPLIAGAIVLGSLAIAGAIYFGLRRTPLAVRQPALPVTVPDAALPVDPSLEERVTIEVAAAIEAQRPRFVRQCWPNEPAGPTMATSRHLFNISVDPQGREVGRGISDPRGESRDDIGRCLRSIYDAPVRISPPGRPVSVVVTMTLP